MSNLKKINVVIVFGLLSSPMWVYLIQFHKNTISNDPEKWGVFGDYLSGTLGTVSAIIGLYYIYLSYRESLRKREEEKEEIKISSFENKFFKLLEFYNQLVNDIIYDQHDSDYHGKKAIACYRTDVVSYLKRLLDSIEWRNPDKTKIQTEINDLYRRIYNGEVSSIGHYFRFVYHIFKYIDESNLLESQKLFYAKLFRSQFTADEMILLGINCLTEYGERFNLYIEKYSVLHRLMNEHELRALFTILYNPIAFGDEKINESLPFDKSMTALYYLRESAKNVD